MAPCNMDAVVSALQLFGETRDPCLGRGATSASLEAPLPAWEP